MKFNLALPGQSLYPGNEKLWSKDITGEQMRTIARTADQLGFDYLRVGEHIVMHERWVPTMGPRWLDCIATLAFVAAATSRIRLATSVTVIPYHNPIDLAKKLATVDYLSNGRLNVTAAAGYMEWEFDLLKVPFAERGIITDEYLDAILELWCADHPNFHGKYVQFEDIAFDPKPTQKPHPPLWIGGHSKASARRVARLGDGWQPWGVPRSKLPEMIEYIQRQPEFCSRPRTLDIFSTLFEGRIDPDTHAVVEPPEVVMEPEAIIAEVTALAALGVTVTDVDALLGWGEFGGKGAEALPPIRCVTEYTDRLHWVAESIFPQARGIQAAGQMSL
jgi:probable F420-dependent oxidoreductase